VPVITPNTFKYFVFIIILFIFIFVIIVRKMNSKLPITEKPYPSEIKIDDLSVDDSINLMIEDQGQALIAIKKSKKHIMNVINSIVTRLNKYIQGRLIYCGAGTSGRIGVQDAVELIPTFGWNEKRLDFIIAGGEKALVKSVEFAEDSVEDAHDIVKKKEINHKDIVIGLAASGNTIFTKEVLKISQKNGALTVGISNNPIGNILKYSIHKIVLDTKEELVAGSTRLKAGTAQKICLNIISTIVMTKLGYVKDGHMINLKPNNQKLKERLSRIKNLRTDDD